MRAVSTKLSILFTLLFFAGMINAQTHTLTVEGADYGAQIAGFGPTLCEIDPFMGEFASPVDTGGLTTVCDTIIEDVTGKIAIVDRGACNFSIKVFYAQQAGATAAIVCNNQATAIITMGPGTFADQITIPSFMVSLEDCQQLKTAISNNPAAMGSVGRFIFDEVNDDVVLWGDQPGEGDFDGGLNGWTVSTLECGGGFDTIPDGFEVWQWSPNGVEPGSCGNSNINSPSVCNGALVFQSDGYNSADLSTAPCGGDGGGVCLSGQTGELISPNIDLSGVNSAGYTLKFYQGYRPFTNPVSFVGWSTDGGMTWDSVQVNGDIAVNASNTAEESVIRVPMTTAAGADSLRVKFRLENANFYYWVVDDVQIIEQEANDLRLLPANLVAAPNFNTPIGMPDDLFFMANFENIGAVAQPNTTVSVDIDGPNTMDVFSDSFNYGEVAANSFPGLENLQPFANSYTPGDNFGTYTVNYSVGSDSTDALPIDNSASVTFAVTDTVLSKDNGNIPTSLRPNATAFPDGAPQSFAYGAVYTIDDDAEAPGGGDYWVNSITIGINVADSAALAGRELFVILYEWEDENTDGIAQVSERSIVDAVSYEMDGTETFGTLQTLTFEETTDEERTLNPGSTYLVMIEYLANADETIFFQSSTIDDYLLTTFLWEQLGAPRPVHMVGVGNAGGTLDVDYEADFFGANTAPVARMNVSYEDCCLTTSSKDLPVIDDQFSIFPNPTSNYANLQLNLNDRAENMTLRIVDISGQNVLLNTYQNVSKETIELNTRTLSAGTYFVEIVTENGIGTQRLIINR